MSSSEDLLLLVADVRDQAFDREHLVGGELGLDSDLSWRLGLDRLDRVGQLDVDLDVLLSLVLRRRPRRCRAERAALATIASFILDMAVPFSPAGLQHSGETRASVEAITMTDDLRTQKPELVA